MRVLPQHRDQGGEIGLKAFTNAVKLITPKPGGINQRQGTEGEQNTQAKAEGSPGEQARSH